RLREEYVSDGVVRFVRHDFPIPVAEWAWPAASAVRSAQHHGGPEAALRYAETIYEHQREYDRRVLATAAREADVDPCTTIEAAIGETYRPVVEADRQRGRDRGVEGTPAVFVEGEPVVFGDEIGYAPVRAAVERHS
ncbi:MAG: DsbA family protein, partial [Halobaculum sp.]